MACSRGSGSASGLRCAQHGAQRLRCALADAPLASRVPRPVGSPSPGWRPHVERRAHRQHPGRLAGPARPRRARRARAGDRRAPRPRRRPARALLGAGGAQGGCPGGRGDGRRRAAAHPAAGALQGLPEGRPGRHGDRLLGVGHRAQPQRGLQGRAPRRRLRGSRRHRRRRAPGAGAPAGRHPRLAGLRHLEGALPPGGLGHRRHGAPGDRARLRGGRDAGGRPLLHDALREGHAHAGPGHRGVEGQTDGGAPRSARAVPQGLRRGALRARPGA